MQNPPPSQIAKSSTGLDENLAALLSYLLQLVGGIVFFAIEKSSRLVRFHAMQSILLNAGAIVTFIALWILWIIIAIILSQISEVLVGLVSVVLGLLFFVVGIGFFIGWVLCMIKAFQGQYFKLPLIGNFADKFSAK
jgi:uncharacterized membrane protein